IVGILGAGVFLGFHLGNGWLATPWLVAGLVLLTIVSVSTAILTQMTFVELSRLRPARPREALTNLGVNSFRLLICNVVVASSIIGCIAGLRALPGWILGNELEGPWGREIPAAAA